MARDCAAILAELPSAHYRTSQIDGEAVAGTNCADAARRQLHEVVDKFEQAKLTAAAQLLADAACDVPAYTAFPEDTWRKIWSNSPLSVKGTAQR